MRVHAHGEDDVVQVAVSPPEACVVEGVGHDRIRGEVRDGEGRVRVEEIHAHEVSVAPRDLHTEESVFKKKKSKNK